MDANRGIAIEYWKAFPLGAGEVAGEARERDGVAEAAATLHVEADAVGLPDLERLARDRDRLALGRAGDVELGHLGVVDRDGQPVAVLGPWPRP